MGQASYKPWQLPGEERWGKEIKSYSCSSSDPRGQKGSAVKFSIERNKKESYE